MLKFLTRFGIICLLLGFCAAKISAQSLVLQLIQKTSPPCYGQKGGFQVAAQGGTPPYQYALQDGLFSAETSFSDLSDGLYTVVARDATGKIALLGVWLTAPAPVSLQILKSNPNCGGGSDGKITATAHLPQGGGDFEYALDDAPYSDDSVFTGLNWGLYTINVREKTSNCEAQTQVLLSEGGMVVTPLPENALCGQNNGKIGVYVQGGQPPFTYALNDGAFQTANVFLDLPPDFYAVRVKDGAGCTSYQTTEVVALGDMSFNVSPVSPTCPGQTNGKITVEVSGGNPPYSYSIDGIHYATQNIFGDLAEGDYQIWVKDAQGCGNTTFVFLESTPITASLATLQPQCGQSGGMIEVAAQGGAQPYQYARNGGAFQSDPLFSELASGQYLISIKDANGCVKGEIISLTGSGNFSYAVEPTPPSCANSADGSVLIFVEGGAPPYQFSIDGLFYQTGNLVQFLPAGYITVYIKDANDCIGNISVLMEAPTDMTVSVNPTDPTCGQADGKIAVVPDGAGAPFLYSINGGPFQADSIFTGLTGGNYDITVKNTAGCTAAVTVEMFSTTEMTFQVVTQDPDCHDAITGKITVLNVTGGTPPYQYSLNQNEIFQSLPTFTQLAAGFYEILVKDANGCLDYQDLTLNNPQPIGFTAFISQPGCTVANGAVMVEITQGAGPFTFELNGQSQPENVFTALAAGNYVLKVKSATGCTMTQNLTLFPQADLSLSWQLMQPTCYGSSDGTIAVSASGGTPPYQYSLDGFNFIPNPVFTFLTGGLYSVYVKDNGGCIDTANVQLSAEISLTFNVINPTCTQADGSITVEVSGGAAPYTYSIDEINYSAANVFNGLLAGYYFITVQDANNCATSNSVSLIGTTNIDFETAQTAPTCGLENGSITVTVTNGAPPYLYGLAPNAYNASNVIYNLSGGAYMVYVLDAQGCMDSAAVTLPVGPPPIAVQFEIQPLTCYNGSDGAITAIISGGTAPYQYIWTPNEQTTPQISNLQAGYYEVHIGDAAGCSRIFSASVPAPDTMLINAQVVPIGDTPGSVSFAITGGTAPYQYRLGDGAWQSENLFTINEAALYTFSVQDAKGCIQYLQVEVPIVIARTEEINTAKWTLYPNPTREILTITQTGAGSAAVLTVSDLTGRTLAIRRFPAATNASLTFSTVDFPAGVYFLKINGINGTNDIRKFVVVK